LLRVGNQKWYYKRFKWNNLERKNPLKLPLYPPNMEEMNWADIMGPLVSFDDALDSSSRPGPE